MLARGKQVCRVRLVEPAQAAVHLAHAAGPPREANAAVTGGQGLLQRGHLCRSRKHAPSIERNLQSNGPTIYYRRLIPSLVDVAGCDRADSRPGCLAGACLLRLSITDVAPRCDNPQASSLRIQSKCPLLTFSAEVWPMHSASRPQPLSAFKVCGRAYLKVCSNPCNRA